MKLFFAGTAIMILTAVAMPLMTYTGLSKEVCFLMLLCMACVGFLFQLAGACVEKGKMDLLDARLRCHMIMSRALNSFTWQGSKRKENVNE
jgi:hypothetical protein